MNDTLAAKAQGSASLRWLLFIAELPAGPDYLRVKLRRRIQRIGAVGLKGSLYVLPENDDTLESFQWLRRELVGDGADATLCSATMIDGLPDDELVMRFNEDRDEEYRALIVSARDEPDHERLQRKLDDIRSRDYLGASGFEEATHVIEQLRSGSHDGAGTTSSAAAFRNRTWATRAGVKVDRISSAWLIRRHIDPDARFVFVAKDAAPPPDSIAFDMYEGEFTHDRDRCTFEVLLDRFAIDDPAVRAIGSMVHDIDLHEETFARPETAGFAAMIRGIVASLPDDESRLKAGAQVLELFLVALGSASPLR